MESKGTLIDVSRDWKTGKMRLTFEFDSDVSAAIDKIKDKLLRITVKLWRDKRSLDANSYYWVLLSRLAEAVGISKPRAHNLMLRKYGQNLVIDSQIAFLVIPDTEEAEETALEAESFHIRPTSQVKQGKDGKMYRTYTVLAGSSTYDTKEMSELINGLVSECKEQGIETLTPDELARMMKDYEENHKKKTV
ncbi:hypothetical protein [Clostridium fessum]|jgi:hypothetical protein|uniref:hypothetical protein n=1 Tax=Clostridium fessum TaxID=2126740 RepID=UPI00205356B6|nr:MAG TPA: NinB protein [Caudoviricetes sp.]